MHFRCISRDLDHALRHHDGRDHASVGDPFHASLAQPKTLQSPSSAPWLEKTRGGEEKMERDERSKRARPATYEGADGYPNRHRRIPR